MTIKKTECGKMVILGAWSRLMEYITASGQNGKKFVRRETVCADILHIVEHGNSKTGDAINFNLPIEYTCDRRCNCYKEGACYASGGCYSYSNNQAGYSENFNFYLSSTSAKMLEAFQLAIDTVNPSLWRYFTCGDIPDLRFLGIMVQLARNNPGVRFWSYTKKYSIVNKWLDENGAFPDNLVIIFSHWLNDDGSYFPMDNRHGLPTSEYIPLGREELLETVTHVCPCSDPAIIANCETCEHPCYKLQAGESMALVEHSTSRTRKRDKLIRAAKEALQALTGKKGRNAA